MNCASVAVEKKFAALTARIVCDLVFFLENIVANSIAIRSAKCKTGHTLLLKWKYRRKKEKTSAFVVFMRKHKWFVSLLKSRALCAKPHHSKIIAINCSLQLRYNVISLDNNKKNTQTPNILRLNRLIGSVDRQICTRWPTLMQFTKIFKMKSHFHHRYQNSSPSLFAALEIWLCMYSYKNINSEQCHTLFK